MGRLTYLQNPGVGTIDFFNNIPLFLNQCLLKIETVIQNQVVGEGVKRTPAYETPLTKHDLDKWRREFWGKLLFYEYEWFRF